MSLKRVVATVELHKLFREISKQLGFTDQDLARYEDNIFDLLELWEQQGFIEIYEQDFERAFGRIKDSSRALGAIPWYLDLYHARISENNDPLLVLRQDNQNSFSIRFLTDHDMMFGSAEQKHHRKLMALIRQRIDQFIQQGN